MYKLSRVVILIAILFVVQDINAQDSLEAKIDKKISEKFKNWKMPFFSFKNGLGITTPDSTFAMHFRFRVQSRMGYTSESDVNFTPSEFDFRVRRIRMRIGGFIYSPRLRYNIQLSFSRADMDWDVTNVPNVLRDAMISYDFKSGFSIAMGQGKLPGNRQRVVSSGELQFADRSIVNDALTLDRDFGLFVNFKNKIKNFHFIIKTAISSGEGRNILNTDAGLCYTGRLELLPLGEFTDGGDYFEGDVVREKKPKISIAGGASFNHMAKRTGGQLGKYLYDQRDIFTAEADLLFKWRGFALSSEYMYRTTDSAYTTDGTNIRYVYIGHGVNSQLSYNFKKNWEIAARYSILIPDTQIYADENQRSEYAICVTKYIMRHRLKLQTDITYHTEYDMIGRIKDNSYFNWRFQIELGI